MNEKKDAVPRRKICSKNKKGKRKLLLILMIVCIAVAAFSAYQLISIFTEYDSAEREYADLRPTASATAPSTVAPFPSAGQSAPAEPLLNLVVPDFAALAQLNDDVAGWIYSPGTVIDYPVVHSGEHDYYLVHTFRKAYNSSGCIFMDKQTEPDFSSRNTTLYGHNMNNGSMFHSLVEYKKAEYWKAHPYMYLFTPDGTYRVDLFSMYVTDAYDTYTTSDFTQEQWNSFVQKRAKRSLVDTGIMPDADDRILTFSTCTYDYDDARFVVHGVLVPIDPVTGAEL